MKIIKKYQLEDLVEKGSHARQNIKPDLLITNSGEFKTGDILDANSTSVYVKEKIDDLIGGASEILDTLGEIEQKFSEVDQSISDIQENQESADLATAASLNDLNSRLFNTGNTVNGALEQIENKADELAVAAAIAILNKKISILFTNIDTINNRLSAIENQMS